MGFLPASRSQSMARMGWKPCCYMKRQHKQSRLVSITRSINIIPFKLLLQRTPIVPSNYTTSLAVLSSLSIVSHLIIKFLFIPCQSPRPAPSPARTIPCNPMRLPKTKSTGTMRRTITKSTAKRLKLFHSDQNTSHLWYATSSSMHHNFSIHVVRDLFDECESHLFNHICLQRRERP